ncbi:hypothetical protein T484DRAFT_1865128, partial [Baffinella frigidus]
DAREVLPFPLSHPVNTVHLFLSQRGGLAVLTDEDLHIATQPVVASDAEGVSRAALEQAGKDKTAAFERIVTRHSSGELSGDDIRWVLLSIGLSEDFVHEGSSPSVKREELNG